MTNTAWDYGRLKALIQGEPLPAMIVNLDVLEENTRKLATIARAHGKYLRVASKSVRVPELLKLIFQAGAGTCRGLMCFSAREAKLLASQGFDDFLIAYPTVQREDLEVLYDMTEQGRLVALVVDEPAHLGAIEELWQERSRTETGAPPLRVCIEADMSWRPLGVHLGVHRSPIRTPSQFEALLERVLASESVRLAGVMGYEAQIAGLGERNPFTPLTNPLKRLIKKFSAKDVAARRQAIAALLKKRGVRLEFFNGGGTGSISTTSSEDCVTEVAAGSGFLQSHLFDYYGANQNEPAFCFALQITRLPQPDMVTCQSGGFIASGEIAPDKAPVPFLPPGLKPLEREGFGEVQTPLSVPAQLRGKLKPGDPVFFRPAKAGEIAERFNEYLLARGEKLVGRAPTYRGLGHCFY